MSQVQYDVTYTEARNRLTNAFRIILAIPHAIFVQVWGYAVGVVAVIQWFIILFTGKRNQGLYNFVNQWMGYASRVYSYEAMLYDPYPKFGTDPSGVPMMFSHEYEEPTNRLTNGLRIIWIIPAAIIAAALAIALFFVSVAEWFIILFTGKANRGIWDFQKKCLHYLLQTSAYGYLMTDTYPKY